jgi:hypothetical protein
MRKCNLISSIWRGVPMAAEIENQHFVVADQCRACTVTDSRCLHDSGDVAHVVDCSWLE